MLILTVAILLILVLASSAIGYEKRGERRDQARFPPPGRLVKIGGGRRLHLHVQGAGGPVVILESGIAATSLSWGLVQSQVAQFTTVCSYDRGGLGWSDPTTTAKIPSALARELRELLRNANLPAPYVLVGHSFGGLVVQRFAGLYREDVCGIVLVDSLNASERHPFRERGIRLSRRGAALARFGVVRACLSMLMGGGRLAPRLAGRLASGHGPHRGTNPQAARGKLARDSGPLVQSKILRNDGGVSRIATRQRLGNERSRAARHPRDSDHGRQE